MNDIKKEIELQDLLKKLTSSLGEFTTEQLKAEIEWRERNECSKS